MLATMRTRSSLVASTIMLLVFGGAASAQTRVFLAGGGIVPVGDFASVADPGPTVAAGVLREAGTRGLAMGVEISYGRAPHAGGDARSDAYGLLGLVAYTFDGLGSVRLTPLVGVGALMHARRSGDFPGLDATRAGPGAMFGIRAMLPVGGLDAFAAGSYVLGFGDANTAAFPTEFLSVTAGLAIPLGS